MPKALHRKLARKATQKGLTGERREAYIYGNKAMKKSHKGGKRR